MAKTLCFCCRVGGLIPGWGDKMIQTVKKKKKKEGSDFVCWKIFVIKC